VCGKHHAQAGDTRARCPFRLVSRPGAASSCLCANSGVPPSKLFILNPSSAKSLVLYEPSRYIRIPFTIAIRPRAQASPGRLAASPAITAPKTPACTRIHSGADNGIAALGETKASHMMTAMGGAPRPSRIPPATLTCP
jgi:hypothetical protein